LGKWDNHQIIRLLNYQMRVAILLSGGLDSAVLLADEAAHHDVLPIYVSVGLAWEAGERRMVARLLADPAAGARHAVVTLAVEMRDVYASTHWAIQGRPPGYHTPDDDVYLPGRNIVLISKAAVYCAAAGIGRLVLGTLAGNPFPDGTADFRTAMARALSLGLGHRLEIEAPYAGVSKADVIRRGAALGVPFELTLSCMNPRIEQGVGTGFPQHCGTCSKCRERHDGFIEAGVADPTIYADMSNIGA
jgi:7-cyano-7-deazaguanine synthase